MQGEREKTAAARYAQGKGDVAVKAALIDMDGVLYDSMKNHTAAWYRMATEMGIECTRDEFYAYEGMTGAAIINILFKRARGREVTEAEAKELYGVKARYFSELGEPEMMPGAAEMLRQLQAAGVECVLVTGSGQDSILQRIERDYPGVFKDGKRVTAHNVKHGKPHPEPYLKGLEMACCASRNAIVIENAPLGVQAGHAAGCFTVGLTTGPIPAAELEKRGAAIVYGSMQEFAASVPDLLEAMREAGK